jgi:hypothetical protein
MPVLPYAEVEAYDVEGLLATVPGLRSHGRGGVPRAAAAAVASPPVPSTGEEKKEPA